MTYHTLPYENDLKIYVKIDKIEDFMLLQETIKVFINWCNANHMSKPNEKLCNVLL